MINLTEKYILEQRNAQGELESIKIRRPQSFNFAYDIVDTIASQEPNKTAMIWTNEEGEQHNFSFADMKRWSDKTANYFKSLGIGKGDFVLAILRRHYQFWFTALALEKIGAVLVPATCMLKKHDLEYRIKSGDIKHIICSNFGDTADLADEVCAEIPDFKNKILVNGHGKDYKACATRAYRDGWCDFNTGVRNSAENLERTETKVDEPMLIYFSSGTAGEPKMVMHNHEYALAHIQTAKYWQQVDPNGLHFTIADTGWAKCAWGKIYGCWACEGANFVYDFIRFKAEDILQKVQDFEVTTLCCPPTMYRMFKIAGIRKYDFKHLKRCLTAGEALNPDLYKFWLERTGLPIYEGFGQTETVCCIYVPDDQKVPEGSMGKPAPIYDLQLINEEGKISKPGEVGEICIKLQPAKDSDDPILASAPGILMRYYKEDEITREAKRDYWYHTGDTAWADEDGFLFYVGRNDDLIKSSGYRIGPHEVESVMLEHDAVAECAITGVPDKVRGAIVKASVVLNAGFSPSEELTKELQKWVKNKTAPYKYPRLIEYVDELPKSISGKIQRAQIRKQD